jgi:hypothetical protein
LADYADDPETGNSWAGAACGCAAASVAAILGAWTIEINPMRSELPGFVSTALIDLAKLLSADAML